MRWVFALVVTGALAGGVYLSGHASTLRSFGTPHRLANLQSKEIKESSGIARSDAIPGEFYTHNDSGDKPRVFRFNQSGKVTAEIVLDGIKVIDCEDISTDKKAVYLADVGDNKSNRKSVQIYRFSEPTGSGNLKINAEVFDLTYPDGSHNCEAFMVDPKTGAFWLVEKVKRGASSVYFLAKPSLHGSNKLQKIGSVEVGSIIPGSQMVTAGDISADGRFVILRTYTALYEFDAGQNLGSWFRRKFTRIESSKENQGEAVCYDRAGKKILTTSEGQPCPLDEISVKKS